MDWKGRLRGTSRGLAGVGESMVTAGSAAWGAASGARAVSAVRAASTAGELAKICGRAGMANAAVEGAMGGFRAVGAMRRGEIDKRQAAVHTAAEAGCGFVTSSAGTAGTLAAYMVTGTLGPFAIAAGMGASVGSRYLYKSVVGETLPPAGSKETKSEPE